MATYKLVFVDIKQDGREGWQCHLEDEDGNTMEQLELDINQVTPALMAALDTFDGLSFSANQIVDEEDNVIGGIDFENKSSAKH